MRTNVAVNYATKTHGGSAASPHVKPLEQLKRTVLSCLLFETTAYEGGDTIADRISALCKEVPSKDIAALAIEARTKHNLRHVSLRLLIALLEKRDYPEASKTIAATIQRPDELAELLAMYWKNGKRPLAKQLKKGLAAAFTKFSAYSLAKYNQDGAVKLRDVLFMVHAKPRDKEQEIIWKQLVENNLPTPDTWETELSAGKDKAATFTRLILEGKLGYLALLRNVRNMVEAGVNVDLINGAIAARKNGADKVLPFRYLAAARTCPAIAPALNVAMMQQVDELPALPGRTVVLVDVSGSMNHKVSSKSELTRLDAAAGLACMLRGTVRTFSFSDQVVEVPHFEGIPGIQFIKNSQRNAGTRLFDAIAEITNKIKYDRIIVLTDEQDTGGKVKRMPAPQPGTKAYIINVAPYKNGVGYGEWTHINGFSENVITWLIESETQ